MNRVLWLCFFEVFLLCLPIKSSGQRGPETFSNPAATDPPARDTVVQDSIRLRYPLKDYPFLSLSPRTRRGLGLDNPSNIKREVVYDPITRQYIIQERLGANFYRPPQYLSFDEYQRYENRILLRNNWESLMTEPIEQFRTDRLIPTIFVESEVFERIFGSNTIDIIPRGTMDITLRGQKNENNNPMFNERQRQQWGFDFDQRIQMNLTGQIGDRLKLTTNYNTEAQFDFENQIRLDYVGKDDDIIQRIEVGNVSMPLNTMLITGTESLFGIKTQLQFGRLNFTGIFSQQRSQQREILIRNGAQESEFALKADDYEYNQHFFLAQYFRNNFNQALAMAPLVRSNVNITQIEVWISNRSNAIDGSRDVLALMDLGEQQPYNDVLISSGNSALPSTGVPGELSPVYSNDLLQQLPADARLTESNAVQSFFRANPAVNANDNYAKLTYARKLNEGTDFTVDRRLGFISLRMPLQGDQVLAVAYRYTANGQEYQVGELSTDVPVTPSQPQMLYAKLLRNEILKTNLPTWDLMMKNIYSIGAYNIGSTNFKFQIYRIEDESGVERPVMTEGQSTQNKLWIQLTGLDRLNPQQVQQPDGYFDFLPGLTIDPELGRVMFPVVEPFGDDLARQFIPGQEDDLIEKYAFTALYDSTKNQAQQLFPHKNRYMIKGSYESDAGTEFHLGAINVPHGSVQVLAGNMLLQEGVDYMVDYFIGRVRILNQALLHSGQPIRIKMENSNLFGLQQRTVMGGRFDYLASDKLQIGGTIMRLHERPLTQKVSIGEEPVSNTMWGVDVNYHSPSRWLTRMVDKIPFIDTKEESFISFYGEFAQFQPRSPKALDFAGSRHGTTYLDDFENSRSYIDLKGAHGWQISGTPQLFPESQLMDDLRYGYNRALLAFYNIDPIFYHTHSRLTPSNINNQERSQHRVREVLEQEVFPYKESPTGLPLYLPTLDLAFYPDTRGPYNYTTQGVNPDGTLMDPASRWGGIFRKIDAQDFEAQNVEFIEIWMMDPFLTNPNSTGGDLYFNLGNISEDILKDGRKALENGMSPTGDLSNIDETNWGRVPKRQPVIQAFDNDPVARARQDIGIDGLSDEDEQGFFADYLAAMQAQLSPIAYQQLLTDPSGDNFTYYRGSELDAAGAGILKRYERINGLEGNARTPEQSEAEFGVETSATTLLPDGEDINRDNNMNETEEYFQYRLSLRPDQMEVGQNYISDVQESEVTLANGRKEKVKWYQMRIPLADGESIGNIQDFKSIRFVRMFMTNFTDTAVIRLAQLQLVRGEWRRYNAENNTAKVITDPELGRVGLDRSALTVSTVNIEQNGNRIPIPYVVPPGIERQLDYGNMNYNVQLNEQALSMEVTQLEDGYGRAAYRSTQHDFRAYGKLEMFIHAEALLPSSPQVTTLKDGDLWGFIRLGTDDQYNYYQYEIPLTVTLPETRDPDRIWPEANRMSLQLSLLQSAKMARSKAMRDGVPWLVEEPFVYDEPNGPGRIILVGQPDISKVRFYMLGVMNPLKVNGGSGQDDGLSKSAVIWFNELRLTEFDRRGGWAATARVEAKLADFANIAVSGRKSTVGFGSLDQRVANLHRSEELYFDVMTNAELGKFFPLDAGMRIPFFFSYTNQVYNPEYNPLMPDMEMNTALATLSRNQRDSLLRVTQDYSTRRSFSFNNVRKIRTNMEKPVRPWDVENLSATYSFSEFYQRDHLTEIALQQNHRASLDYSFSSMGQQYYEPFKKLVQSDYLALLRDFNFNLMPSMLHFRIDVNRIYNENTLRQNSPDNYLPTMGSLYNKNFNFNRIYGISWNLTRNLKLDFNATNYAIVDEPDGRLNGLKRDTLWENFWRLGRTTDYNHQLNVTYTLPMERIPGLDWVQVDTRYGAQFMWQTEPRFAHFNADMQLGNSIQNGRTIQVNPRFGLVSLYNKFGFIRNHTGPSAENGFLSFMVGLLTSVKDINGAYTRVESTLLPGYLPKTNALGYDFDHRAPGWGFIFGSQADIRPHAAAKGWITTDTLQNQLYMTSLTEDLSLRAMAEPVKGLHVDLSAVKIENKSYRTSFQYDPEAGTFISQTPFDQGMFSISQIAISTSFQDHDMLFKQFEAAKRDISAKFGAKNPHSTTMVDGFAEGYGKNAQDVVVEAFLSTYTGRGGSSGFLSIPLPNWRITYSGLSDLPFFREFITSLTLSHGYNSQYAIAGYQSTPMYREVDGYPSQLDTYGNFLPEYQFQQISLLDQFVPLIGLDMRFQNGLTSNVEYRRSRNLNLSLQNSQLAMLTDRAVVVGMGYRASGFRLPFGWFERANLTNDLNFRLDVAINDLKTVVYREDVEGAEVSAGNKSVSFRPSIDYLINQRFNVRLFYDSNSVRPYTSQTFATSYMNFGFTLRVMLQ